MKRNASTLEERNLKITRNSVLEYRKMNVQPHQQPAPPVAAAAAAPQQIQPLPLWETEANTLNLQGEHCLLRREQCAKLREEGYSSLSDLINWKYKHIRSLLENLSNRPSSRDGSATGRSRNCKPCAGSSLIEAVVDCILI